jgi:outer membrane protein assembly factor BamB
LYVATNLGTVAAVAVATGSVEWLATYSRQSDTQWRDAVRASIRTSTPWQFNPVYTADRFVVVCPLDSPNLLVLNRADGALIRTIDKDIIGGGDAILGLRDNLLYVASDRTYCLDLNTARVRWSKPFPPDAQLVGRGFIADQHIIVPTTRGISAFRLIDGEHDEHRWNGDGPSGNLITAGDRLIIAAADHVAAYGSKYDVWNRYQRRMSERPNDPEPAIVLAEIAFRAGDYDQTLRLMTTAVKRLNLSDEQDQTDIRIRAFNHCLTFAKGSPDNRPDPETAAKLFDLAAVTAHDIDSRVRYRMVAGAYFAEHNDPKQAVDFYQQIINDHRLRNHQPQVAGSPSHATAGTVALESIQQIIRSSGRDAYQSFDDQAAAWLLAVQSTDAPIDVRTAVPGNARTDQHTDKLAIIDRILTETPAAIVIPQALRAKADILQRTNQPVLALRVWATILHEHCPPLDPAQIKAHITQCLVDADQPQIAAQWATRLFLEHPNATIRLRDRNLTTSEFRDRFVSPAESHRPPTAPTLTPPLTRKFERIFDHNITLLSPLSTSTLAPKPPPFAVVYGNHSILAINPTDGTWQWPAPARCEHQPALLALTENRVILATDHRLFALDAANGREVWSTGSWPPELDDQKSDPETVPSFLGHAVNNHRVVSLTDHGVAAALDTNTGRLLWQTILPSKPASSPILTHQYVTFCEFDQGRFRAVLMDANTGQILYRLPVESDSHLLQLHTTQDDKLVAVYSNLVVAYDCKSGNPIFKRHIDGNILDESVLFDLGAMYVSINGNTVEKISLRDGRTRWISESLHGLGLQTAKFIRRGSSVLALTDRAVIQLHPDRPESSGSIRRWSNGNVRYRFATPKYAVGVDTDERENPSPATATFIPLKDPLSQAQPSQDQSNTAPDPKVVEFDLGPRRDIVDVQCVDGALLIQRDRTLVGWSSTR